MPVVPTPQRRVQPAGLPAPRLTTNVPQAAVGVPSGGLDLSAVRDQAIRIGQEEKQKANQIQLTDASGRLTAHKTRVGTEMVSKKGQNAFGSVEQAHEDYEKGAQDIEDSLGSDELKLAFQRMRASGWSELNNQGQYHLAAERVQYDKDSTKAALEAQQVDARANYQFPDLVEQRIATQKVLWESFGKRMGMDEQSIKNAQAESVSSTRMDVFTALSNTGEDLAAEAYFKKHQSDFIGKDLEQATRVAEQGSILGHAQQQSSEIIGRTKTMPEALAEAKKIVHPRVQEKTLDLIREHYRDLATAATQEREQTFEAAGQIVAKTHNFNAVPVSMLDKLTHMQIDHLKSDADELRHPKKTTDEETYRYLANVAGLNPEKFKTLELGQYAGKLTTSDWESFVDRQLNMRLAAGRGEDSEIDKAITRADADARYYLRAAQREAVNQEPAKQKAWEAEYQKAKAEGVRLRAQKAGIVPPPPAPGLEAPSLFPGNIPRGTAPRAPTPAQSIPAPARSPEPLAGLSQRPLAQPTISMLRDIVQWGPGYALHLREMGVAAPSFSEAVDLVHAYDAATAPPAPPAEPKKPPKKPKSVSIIRDDSGRAVRLVPE